jgi:hypothetical protein
MNPLHVVFGTEHMPEAIYFELRMLSFDSRLGFRFVARIMYLDSLHKLQLLSSWLVSSPVPYK